MKPDLNLLVVFEAVARCGSVTQAANVLGLSQPAVSHALNRLRGQVGDALFTRAGRGLVPTPRAQAMMGPVQDVLAGAGPLLARTRFDARKDVTVFRVGVSDYAGMTVMPAVMQRLDQAAPGVTVVLTGVGEATLGHLGNGALDLTFWGTRGVDAPFRYQRLFAEHYVGVARAGHAIFASGATLREYVAHGHVVVSLGDPGASAVDAALRGMGLARKVRLVSPSFAGNLAVVAQTDLLATMPARLWAAGGPVGLRAFDLPLAVPSYDYGMVWHARTDASPAHCWLRTEIMAACA